MGDDVHEVGHRHPRSGGGLVELAQHLAHRPGIDTRAMHEEVVVGAGAVADDRAVVGAGRIPLYNMLNWRG